MHNRKAFSSVHRLSKNTHCLEVIQNIRFNSFKLRLCLFQGLFLNSESDILGFDKSVVALCKLIFEHIRIFLSDIVKFIILRL